MSFQFYGLLNFDVVVPVINLYLYLFLYFKFI